MFHIYATFCDTLFWGDMVLKVLKGLTTGLACSTEPFWPYLDQLVDPGVLSDLGSLGTAM